MPSYRFRLIDNGEAVQECEHELANDFEAFKVAEATALDFDVELSDGRRFLAHIHKKDRAKPRSTARAA